MQHKGAMDPFPRTHVGIPQKGNLTFLGPPLSNGFNKGLGVLFVAYTQYNLIQSMLIAIQNSKRRYHTVDSIEGQFVHYPNAVVQGGNFHKPAGVLSA